MVQTKGCHMNKMRPLEQSNYNITVITDLGMIGESPKRQRYALFECPTCHKHFEARTEQIRRGTINGWDNNCINCGNTKRATKHGDTGTDLHNKWNKMLSRTRNKAYEEHYSNVEVCSDWLDYETFKEWALSNNYKVELELDRIDSKGNYEPSNCRFTTREVQTRNTSKRKDNTSGYRGVSKLRDKYRARITVDKKVIYLGVFGTAIEAGISFNEYVLSNNLEHTLNDIGELPTLLKDN